MPLPPLRYYQFSERGRAMPSQSSNPKKPRIRNLRKIQAEQNGYILSEEDLSTLQHWKATLTPLNLEEVCFLHFNGMRLLCTSYP